MHEPDFGCKAVHAEWEWSGRRSLLARRCMQDLVRTLEVRACCQPLLPAAAAAWLLLRAAWRGAAAAKGAAVAWPPAAPTPSQLTRLHPTPLPAYARAQARKKPRMYLEGYTGSGKSVALYSLVAWARAHGWLALYVPSAFSLVQRAWALHACAGPCSRGGLHRRGLLCVLSLSSLARVRHARPRCPPHLAPPADGTYSQGEDGLWDTPEAARWILAALREAHAPQLAALKTPAGQPLADLVEEGLAPGAKPGAVVAAAVAAKDAVAQQRELPALLAVDDYNVLYSHTGGWQ